MVPYLIQDLQFAYKTFGFHEFDLNEFLSQVYLYKFEKLFKEACLKILSWEYQADVSLC